PRNSSKKLGRKRCSMMCSVPMNTTAGETVCTTSTTASRLRALSPSASRAQRAAASVTQQHIDRLISVLSCSGAKNSSLPFEPDFAEGPAPRHARERLVDPLRWEDRIDHRTQPLRGEYWQHLPLERSPDK